MINIYHCKKCHYEWESIKYEFRCPRCGADVEVMVEMALQFYNQFLENPDKLEQHLREKDSEAVQPNHKTGCAMSPTDKRREIEHLYTSDNENIRYVIERSIKCIVIDRKNKNILTARLNNGEIEIVDEASGKIIPWSQLDDNEKWLLWNNFNDLLEEIEKIRHKK